jgi:uncharacterized protein
MKSILSCLTGIYFFPLLLLGQLNPTEISIPMRDGQSLGADLYLPASGQSYPTVLIQTPYNKNFYRYGLPLLVGQQLSSSPFAFVIVDWRCHFSSAPACGGTSTRGQDGYDAVEWIAAQSWSNGKVGTWGPSALGGVQFETAWEQPPHLTCAVPMVCAPGFTYSDFYTGGVLHTDLVQQLGVLFGTASFSLIMQNPARGFIWQQIEKNAFRPDRVKIPMLQIGGWYDHNIKRTWQLFDSLRDGAHVSVRDKQWIVVGPWVHGGSGQAVVGSLVQGELTYPLAERKSDSLARKFFDYFLSGTTNGWGQQSACQYYLPGEERWVFSANFPPVVQWRPYYLSSNEELLTTPPAIEETLSFTYDPLNPSPTHGGKTMRSDMVQGPYDQRFSVESRNDLLRFQTGILTESICVAGRPRVELYVSSDRPDTDFMVRLTDVYPDGKSILVLSGAQRLRFRNGVNVADTGQAVIGNVYKVTLELDPIAYAFMPGHRIRLLITSSNYPQFNRNANTGGVMYPNSSPDSLISPAIASNTVCFGGDRLSRLLLPRPTEELILHGNPGKEMPYLIHNPGDELRAKLKQGRWRIQIYDLGGRLRAATEVENPEFPVAFPSLENGIYVAFFHDFSSGEKHSFRWVKMGRD